MAGSCGATKTRETGPTFKEKIHSPSVPAEFWLALAAVQD
jgi:hypothetical protein